MTDLEQLENDMLVTTVSYLDALTDDLINQINDLNEQLRLKDETILSYEDAFAIFERKNGEYKSTIRDLVSQVAELERTIQAAQNDAAIDADYIRSLEAQIEEAQPEDYTLVISYQIQEDGVYGPARG